MNEVRHPFSSVSRLLVRGLICLAALTGSTPPYATTSTPVDVNAQRLIQEFADLLATGRNDTFQHLTRLGFGDQISELNRAGVSTASTFSAQTVVEGLYRRAEAAQAGEGNRFLAVLYKDAAPRSAALATDPAFSDLKALSESMPPLKQSPIRFAPVGSLSPSALSTPLPPAAEAAVGKLADYYGARGIAQARAALLSNLRKSGFSRATFDSILMAAPSPEGAIRQMLDAGTPPPPPEIALRNLLRDSMRNSAILAMDAQTLRLVEELSQGLPPEYERYAVHEGELGSRRAQAAAAEGSGRPGTVAKASDADVVDLFRRPPDAAPGATPPPWNPSPPDSGGGGGGAPGLPPQLAEHGKAYDRYVDTTLESRNGPKGDATPRTPRSFAKARYSARAGRGVSVGAEIRHGELGTPIKAFWVTQRDDSRFGRLYTVLQFPDAGRPVVAASRVMFTDSFRSAVAARWGKWNETAQFREGDILILMSMDPKHRVSFSSLASVVAAVTPALTVEERERLRVLLRLHLAGSADGSGLDELNKIMNSGLSQLPPDKRKAALRRHAELKPLRGIVFHPSLVGRELSWSTARVDFWFNQLDALVVEARLQNPGTVDPPISQLPEGMGTWQFYERQSTISISGAGDRRELVVSSTSEPAGASDPPTARRSHFAVSIFSKQDGPGSVEAEDNYYRRPDMERQLQPLLGWLATRHHDFMRLNDFSESFTLLRWLHRTAGVAPVLVDMSGDSKAISTPDRVNRDTGQPALGAKK